MNIDNQGIKLLLWANLCATAYTSNHVELALITGSGCIAVAWALFKHGLNKGKTNP